MPTNTAQWLTLTLIAIVMAVIVWYDVWVAIVYGPNATISRVLKRLFDGTPILYPVFWLAVGVLIGHLGLPTQ
jgi:hypothetical protein